MAVKNNIDAVRQAYEPKSARDNYSYPERAEEVIKSPKPTLRGGASDMNTSGKSHTRK